MSSAEVIAVLKCIKTWDKTWDEVKSSALITPIVLLCIKQQISFLKTTLGQQKAQETQLMWLPNERKC